MCTCQRHDCASCTSNKPVPHKHAALIKAWADGAKVQCSSGGHFWEDVNSPVWNSTCLYRIKPVPKPDVVLLGYMATNYKEVYHPDIKNVCLCGAFSAQQLPTDNLKAVYDGETGVLKSVELIK